MMDYVYFLPNASLTLRAIEYLQRMDCFPSCTLAVIHQINGWVIRVKFSQALCPLYHGNFQAFIGELGIVYQPEMRLQMVFWSLETGQSVVEVMRRYQIAIVSYGSPDTSDIEAFKEQFTKGLGYCPETLA